MKVTCYYVTITVTLWILVTAEEYATEYKYLLADLDRCRTESPDVLIWVQGRVSSPNLRSMIRESIGNSQLWGDNLKVMTVFFTGTLPQKYEKYVRLLEYEYQMYRDIVQTDFREDYRNQTSKMISAINYIADYCNGVKLILRIDDDVVFLPQTMQNLSHIMNQNSNATLFKNLTDIDKFNIPPNTIACRLISDFGVWRLKDHPGHFNAVDDSVLPGEDMYPPFCAGFFIAMSGDVPRRLQVEIKTNKPFWMDDRYMGVLQKRAGTTNIDIASLLDFGYKDITLENLDDLASSQLLAKHLPGHLKLHNSQIFQYIQLASRGLKSHFETVAYKIRKT